jgi:hypothetical protein
MTFSKNVERNSLVGTMELIPKIPTAKKCQWFHTNSTKTCEVTKKNMMYQFRPT